MPFAAVDRLRSLPRRVRVRILLGAALLASAAMPLVPPVAQDPAYHAFADGRAFLGIPNFGDAASNLPFVAAGLLGIALIPFRGRAALNDPAERPPLAAFFGSLALTGAGSFYYHLAPDNARLFWDRLPMALLFASFLSVTVAERIGARAGARLCLPLMALGAASVLYWRLTEARGAGDLRPYALAQYLAILLVLLAALLFPPRYTREADLLGAAAAYGLAKAAEALDRPIYALTGLASGHTLKHLLAGAAGALVLAMVLRRRPLPLTDSLPPCSPAPPAGPSAPSAPSGSRPA